MLLKNLGWILKTIWKCITYTRVALANLIFIALIVLIFVSFNQKTDIEQSTVEPSALVLNISGPIVEKSTRVSAIDSLGNSVLGQSLPQENVLFDIVDAIRAAKSDDNITGIVLSLSNMANTNVTKLDYIAKALQEFKTSGKPVYASGDFYSQSQYYLASYADKVFLSPNGGVLLKGYSSYPMYYRRLLEKMDITTHVFRVGTYKSAVEPFIRNGMSPEAKKANLVWLNQLWDSYLDKVSTNRKIEPQSLNLTEKQFISQFKQADGSMATLALNLGLVDELASRPMIRQELSDIFGSDHDGGYRRVSLYNYLSTINFPESHSSDQIAVIVASGAIMDGHQPAGRLGGDDIAAQLHKARINRNVRAVVLRVDSPGGSAFASEVIRNEIEELRAANKPVVVSMSSLAASGGYWIAMSANKIIASPTTLTGSIGIFSVIPTFEKAMDKLGVSTDGVGTTLFSGESVTKGLSRSAQQTMQLAIENGYKTFISLVSENRDIGLAEVDKIAQGRVWTGKDALNLGLVDQLGDFDDAVSAAATLADISDYRLQWLKEPESMTEQVLNELLSGAQSHIGIQLESVIPPALKGVSNQVLADVSLLNQFNDPHGQYALCLTCQTE
ncbi:signal peptide peptidase SppA [Vibrio sp. WJH972]